MRKRLRKVYRRAGTRGPDKISPGEELRGIVKRHRKTLKVIPNDIELWFAFFDEAVAFWFAVWGNYYEKVTGPSDKLQICLMALSGRVFQDMICIREMIAGGFSVQSNVVARSLIEGIDVMHLLNSRPELANEFQEIKENTESSKFWHKYCSRDKIHKIVKGRWLWFFKGDEKAATSFHQQRQDYLDLTGMSVHPSFGASFTTFMDSSKNQSNSIFDNAMGSISHMSKFTMHLIVLRVFEYGFLWSGPEISLYGNDDDPKSKAALHDNISKGLSAMISIVSATQGERDGDPFFPEFETYWPRPQEA
jgi:hypothetical protein